VSDPLVPACGKTAAQINTMTVKVGNKNNILEAGESFSYNCSSTTLATAFPNDENVVTVNALTADTFKAPVTTALIT